MIDAWFSLLAISFLSSVGGLVALAMQAWRDEEYERNEYDDKSDM